MGCGGKNEGKKFKLCRRNRATTILTCVGRKSRTGERNERGAGVGRGAAESWAGVSRGGGAPMVEQDVEINSSSLGVYAVRPSGIW